MGILHDTIDLTEPNRHLFVVDSSESRSVTFSCLAMIIVEQSVGTFEVFIYKSSVDGTRLRSNRMFIRKMKRSTAQYSAVQRSKA